MPKQVHFDFYTVEMPEGCDSSFSDILDRIQETPQNERNRKIRGEPVRVLQIEKLRDRYYGNLVRIRFGILPGKTKVRGGPVVPIPLKEDESIGEQTAFLYVPSQNVLVLQRNGHGVTRLKAVRYFEAFSEEEPIAVVPAVHPDAYARLGRFTQIRQFEVRVAGVTNRNLFASERHSISTVNQLMNDFRAPSIHIKLSLDTREQSTLNVGRVVAAARRLCNFEEAKTIKVRGRASEDEDVDVINLITDRISYVENISFETNKPISYDKIRAALVQAWTKRSPLVRRFRRASAE